MTRRELYRRVFFVGGLGLAAAWVLGLALGTAEAQHPAACSAGTCATVPTYNAPPAYAYPAAAVVPVYTAVYSPRAEPPAGDPGAADDTAAAIRELAAEVRALRAELAAIREQAAAPPGQAPAPAGAPKQLPPPKLSALDIARTACLTCHAPGNAEAKGGGFALFADDGGKAWANLSPRDRVRIGNRVKNGTMPPPPAKMNEPFKSELSQWAATSATLTPKK